jgi:hypothetical protein
MIKISIEKELLIEILEKQNSFDQMRILEVFISEKFFAF